MRAAFPMGGVAACAAGPRACQMLPQVLPVPLHCTANSARPLGFTNSPRRVLPRPAGAQDESPAARRSASVGPDAAPSAAEEVAGEDFVALAGICNPVSLSAVMSQRRVVVAPEAQGHGACLVHPCSQDYWTDLHREPRQGDSLIAPRLAQDYWEELHREPWQGAPFRVRGPGYLADRKKVPAGCPMFQLTAVDLVRCAGHGPRGRGMRGWWARAALARPGPWCAAHTAQLPDHACFGAAGCARARAC